MLTKFQYIEKKFNLQVIFIAFDDQKTM